MKHGPGHKIYSLSFFFKYKWHHFMAFIDLILQSLLIIFYVHEQPASKNEGHTFVFLSRLPSTRRVEDEVN